MKISAYAKLNLSLDIVGRREDGYHLLDMVMQEIDLADCICVEKAEDISVECDIALPLRNTAYVAAEKFFELTHIQGGAKITIEKHIPDKAGLGGGSSDAAAVIKALDRIYNTGLSFEQMTDIASMVGSDVPFFINGGSARVEGVGEKTRQIKNNLDCFYVLAKPESGVSTVEAYKKYHETTVIGCDTQAVISALEKGDISLYAKNAKNALEKAAMLLNPDIVKIKEIFTQADFCMMTGSGSCAFAVYKNKNAAEAAFEKAKKNELVAFCHMCQGISK